MYNENTNWFSQTLMYIQDRAYQTEGKLRIAITTNSQDNKNFNPPCFNLALSNNFQKTCNLNINHATDLIQAFASIQKAGMQDAEIVRRITPNIELVLKFKLDQNNLPVVEMLLLSSSTDFTKIIIPMADFNVLAHRLKNFVNKYDDLCYQLMMKNIDGEYRNIIQQLPGLIKGISSQIIPGEIQDSGAPVEEVRPSASAETINELDNFLGGSEMENIDVPELKSKHVEPEQTTFAEVKSPFVDFLKNDLSNIENVLTNIEGDKNPLLALNDDFIQHLGSTSFLPGLEGDQLKSMSYISKLLCSMLTKAHINLGVPIPSTTPPLKYKVNEIKPENMELAYDLITFMAYMRTLRNRLSDKMSDFIENKSRVYLQMRCFMDAFTFSFLEKSDKKQLESIINNRFKYFDSIGVFDNYKELLKNNNCPGITCGDIDAFVREANEKIIGKSYFILPQHDALVNSHNFRIGSSNNFNLEQIINEVIPIEVDEKCGIELNSETLKEYSKEVQNYFKVPLTPTKVKQKKETKEKTSNVVRFATHFRNEIPDQYKEEFLEWLKSVADKNFPINDCKFPLAEFGDNVIKGLYLWKPEDDQKVAKNYKYFYTQFENCMMEKDHILALGVEKKEEKADEWSSAFDNVTF